MMRRLLEMAGYDVVEASDGQQAVEVTVQERPDLILMDLSLPKLDGLAATRLIRQHRDVSKIPIIAVSAHDSPRVSIRSFGGGMRRIRDQTDRFRSTLHFTETLSPQEFHPHQED